MDKYDYIIAGAGASGLSLLIHLIDSGKFNDKKILLVDKDEKNRNDRTWCFWEKTDGLFEPIVYQRWSSAWFHDQKGSALHLLRPYQYKLIRGIDFYEFCFTRISAAQNVTVLRGNIERITSEADGARIIVNGQSIPGKYLFNSIPFSDASSSAEHFLLQHFKGWVIETESAAFDPSSCTLMDFRVQQHQGYTTFLYVMPFSKNKALVEYTLFSPSLLADERYDEVLSDYCRVTLGLDRYQITEKEKGAIPMTDFVFPGTEGNIIHIGTQGGQTKASSGYTFQFIQKQSRAIVRELMRSGKPFVRAGASERKFRFYDKILLRILTGRRFPGDEIFSILMRTNPMINVFKFLDNETSLLEDLRIIRKLPKRIFVRAVWK